MTHYYPGTIAAVVALAYAITFQTLTPPTANFAPHILPMVGIATLAALTWMYLPLPRDATTEPCWGFHHVEGIRRENE